MELEIGGPENNQIAKSSYTEVIELVKDELSLAAEYLPTVLENYDDVPVTNQRKGRASKWAAKAYLARIALMEKDWATALELSTR